MKQQTLAPPRTDNYYRRLTLAHILGHDAEKTHRALNILNYTEEKDTLEVGIETVRAMSGVLGTDPIRLVRDYGLGKNKVTIDELEAIQE